ncbi:MAG: 50S ribosomal protein L23 [Gammaproteobacteria bacterium]|nr:50S ribosomal protein L23 [Gammaproteobacteria bacterium]
MSASAVNTAREERKYEVLRSPHITEKATRIADESRQYVFRVAKDATKKDIARAVEEIFKVEVLGVTTLHVKGKLKGGFGRRKPHRQASWKKAYVRIAEGQDIDFLSVG